MHHRDRSVWDDITFVDAAGQLVETRTVAAEVTIEHDNSSSRKSPTVFPSSPTLPQEDQPRCVGHFSELR
jgi:hypothetical protein